MSAAAGTALALVEDELWQAIAADQNPRAGVCHFCKWLGQRPKTEQASWERVMSSSFTTQSLLREAQKRGYKGKSDSAILHHRRGHPDAGKRSRRQR